MFDATELKIIMTISVLASSETVRSRSEYETRF